VWPRDAKCGRRELQVDIPSTDLYAFSPDEVSDVEDVELLVLLEVSAEELRPFGLVARGGGSAGSEEGYFVWVETDGDTFLCGAMYSGMVLGYMPTYSFVSEPNTKYWVRFNIRTEEDDTRLRGKIWELYNEEPWLWQLNCIDYDTTWESGWVGVHAYTTDGNVDWFGVDTAGNTVDLPACATAGNPTAVVRFCPHCKLVYSPDSRIYTKDPNVYCPRCQKKLIKDKDDG